MHKYTKGPWFIEEDVNEAGESFWNVVCDQDGFDRFVVGNEGLFRCDGSDEANAKLIAAAPEMYEFIKRYIHACDGGIGGDSCLYIDANGIIKKVEGE